MGGLDGAFAISSKLSTSGYSVHIRTYRNETDAHRAHHLLEQLDHFIINNVFFNLEPQQHRNTILFVIGATVQTSCECIMRRIMAAKKWIAVPALHLKKTPLNRDAMNLPKAVNSD